MSTSTDSDDIVDLLKLCDPHDTDEVIKHLNAAAREIEFLRKLAPGVRLAPNISRGSALEELREAERLNLYTDSKLNPLLCRHDDPSWCTDECRAKALALRLLRLRRWPGEPPHCPTCECGMERVHERSEDQKREAARDRAEKS
jgi:hypothetical protein